MSLHVFTPLNFDKLFIHGFRVRNLNLIVRLFVKHEATQLRLLKKILNILR